MTGSLQGIKVLDLSRILGGPLCGQILGDHGADVLRAAVGAAVRLRIRRQAEAELGGDGDLVAHRRQRLADHFLANVGAVDFRRVEEVHSLVVGTAQQAHHLAAFLRRGVEAGAGVQAAKPER